mmetsp:Transcript_61312/g.158137  ORF Transcript_61312/g.158137 Transcript_61312/m.158137 type:complete len:319 (-) Transcript_61312:351-1307(-)
MSSSETRLSCSARAACAFSVAALTPASEEWRACFASACIRSESCISCCESWISLTAFAFILAVAAICAAAMSWMSPSLLRPSTESAIFLMAPSCTEICFVTAIAATRDLLAVTLMFVALFRSAMAFFHVEFARTTSICASSSSLRDCTRPCEVFAAALSMVSAWAVSFSACAFMASVSSVMLCTTLAQAAAFALVCLVVLASFSTMPWMILATCRSSEAFSFMLPALSSMLWAASLCRCAEAMASFAESCCVFAIDPIASATLLFLDLLTMAFAPAISHSACFLSAMAAISSSCAVALTTLASCMSSFADASFILAAL